MNWQDAVERTVTGLGYDLVDAEKSAGGLLRVFIDHLPAENAPERVVAPEKFITVDDCEKVTRQLQHVLEVDSIAYERLEVSSPGLDRPLKKAADYARFCGEQIELNLKVPFKGRKKYRGELRANGDGWRLVLGDAKVAKGPSKGRGKAAAAAKVGASGADAMNGDAVQADAVQAESVSADLALDFSLDEVRDAHLVPVVDFKGRRFATPAEQSAPGFAPAQGMHSNDEVDGGRIQ